MYSFDTYFNYFILISTSLFLPLPLLSLDFCWSCSILLTFIHIPSTYLYMQIYFEIFIPVFTIETVRKEKQLIHERVIKILTQAMQLQIQSVNKVNEKMSFHTPVTDQVTMSYARRLVTLRTRCSDPASPILTEVASASHIGGLLRWNSWCVCFGLVETQFSCSSNCSPHCSFRLLIWALPYPEAPSNRRRAPSKKLCDGVHVSGYSSWGFARAT